MFGLERTLGAYCGSISTTSAPVALRRARPSCRSEACGGTALPRSTELVPTCHSTKSGFSAITAVSRRASMLRSEEHTSELQSLRHLVCRLLLEKKKKH